MSQRSSNNVEVDAVVFGTGIMGLVLAKRLLDLGQIVAVVEKSATLADGASVQNHGWIHYGTTHSISASTVEQGSDTARRLQFGHDFFQAYAPECFDQPFEKTYVVVSDPAQAERARQRWTVCNVPYRELSRDEFFSIEPNLKPGAANYFFEVADGRVNTRLLFKKLYTDIVSRGAVVLTGAEYRYEGLRQIVVDTPDASTRINSKLFLYATGAGTGEAYELLTGKHLPLQFFKSHMLFVPRLTNVSIISLDRDSPIIINHGDISAINRSHDEIATTARDETVHPEEVTRSLAALSRMYKTADALRPQDVRAIAALKPYVSSDSAPGRHRIDPSIYEPIPGHIFALPGKMTAAPFLAAEIIKHVFAYLDLAIITPRPFDMVPISVAPKQRRIRKQLSPRFARVLKRQSRTSARTSLSSINV